MNHQAKQGAAGPYDKALMWRLCWTNLLAWTAITFALALYVLRAYPEIEDSSWAVLGRQAANWMPFALGLPALYAVGCWLRSRTTPRLRVLVWIVVCTALVVGYASLRFAALALLSRFTGTPAETWIGSLNRMWPIAVIVCGVLVSVLLGVYARIGRREAEAMTRRLESELTRAQLRALQSRIRPHFLFNTLQAIEDACWHDAKTASTMVLQLAELLRASLENEARPLAALAKDVDLARKYVALQQARFGERLQYEEDIDASMLDQPFPTLFLQPLLENAIVHGIETLPGGGTVRLAVRRDGDDLVLRITNDGPALNAELELDVDLLAPATNGVEGMGLANTVARLRTVYGAAAQLTIAPRAGGGASLEARVPLRPVS